MAISMALLTASAGKPPDEQNPAPMLLTAVVAFLLVSVGVALGNAWLSYAIGRLCYRLAGRPSMLLGARRLMADPWFGSRIYAVLLISLIFGAVVAYAHSLLASQAASDTRGIGLINAGMTVLATICAAGLLVVLVESIVAQRRTLAALVAAGTPRSVLALATLWQVLFSFLPCALLALLAGTVLSLQIWGKFRPPFPLQDLLALGGSASAIVLLAAAGATLALRSSTRVNELRYE